MARSALTVCLLVAAFAMNVFGSQKIQPKKPAKPKPPAAKNTFPNWDKVKTTTASQLGRRIGYRKGDILSRGDANRVLDALKKVGWKVADAKAIAGQFLSDGDSLVRQLRSRRGVPFMRKLAGNKQVYDRMDRLRSLPLGARRIPELINNPGGYTLILYMVKTPGGKNLGRYLNQTPSGRNFNKPTGRIYTEDELIDRLKFSYDAAAKKGQVKPRPKPKSKRKSKPEVVFAPRGSGE